jgi:small-conductance mechanosensitive channel
LKSIQTEERDLTTLPNLLLVSHPITVIRSSGTIVSATVSLRYDIAHQTIEKLLVDAAIAAKPKDPFVPFLELGDYSVTYRVAGFLGEVKHLLSAHSKLRAMMLSTLHDGGIEIVSPMVMNQRQLETSKGTAEPFERKLRAWRLNSNQKVKTSVLGLKDGSRVSDKKKSV